MNNRITDLLSFCSRVDFGIVPLSREEESFRVELNREMLLFCEYLPKSMQTKSVLFFMEYLHASFNENLNFVKYFYTPAWSILFWLHRSCPDNKKLGSKHMRNAKTGHIMAMFLHAFDDHLSDGQLSVTHMALLLRSQSWMIMNRAFERLAKAVEGGPAIVRNFIDDYYSSIGTSEATDSLDGYCSLFRKQMATWLIVPILLARRVHPEGEFSQSVQSAYTSFGIAWRLLDDLQDLDKDIAKGVHSSIYACLDEDWKILWDKAVRERTGRQRGFAQDVLNGVLQNKVIDRILERTCCELESAASIADACGMPGFGHELRSLMKPLTNESRCLC